MVENWINTFYEFLRGIGYTHPVHPTMVHMPIGLVAGAFAFVLGAFFLRWRVLTPSARHCVILAFLFVFPTVTLGLMDWQHFYGGAWLFPIKVKMGLAGTLMVLLFLAILISLNREKPALLSLAVYGLCFCCVVALGYFGGQLVYGGRSEAHWSTAKKYQAGERIYSSHCSGCHPGGQNVIDPSKPVIGSLKLTDFQTFLSWIRDPVSPMPAFTSAKISEKEAKELYEYIKNELGKSSANPQGTGERS